jgi:hypothetical protein
VSCMVDGWTFDELTRKLLSVQDLADTVLGRRVVDLTPEWQPNGYAVAAYVYGENAKYLIDPSPDCDPVIDFLMARFDEYDWSEDAR